MRLTRAFNPIYWCVSLDNGDPLLHVTVRIFVADGPNDDAALRHEIEGMIVSAVNKDADADAAIRQRDDLLAALKDVLTECDEADRESRFDGDDHRELTQPIRGTCKAAIAKATPQKAARTPCTKPT